MNQIWANNVLVAGKIHNVGQREMYIQKKNNNTFNFFSPKEKNNVKRGLTISHNKVCSWV